MNFIDQMGLRIALDKVPQRIISLVPSQTELLHDLGLGDRLVGITRFCIHPKDKFTSYTKVGGTKDFDFTRISELQPDLIIGNKEENYEEGIERLRKQYPVWMSDINSFDEALDMIHSIGDITGTEEKVKELLDAIKQNFNAIKSLKDSPSVVYLIWKEPMMAVGGNNFINDMLSRLGFENVLVSKESRYPEVEMQELITINPKFVFLSSEPYPFKERHLREMQEALPAAEIVLVDGEYFSWYGSRMKLSVAYFKKLLQELQ